MNNNKIKFLREEHNLKQEQVAQIIGIERSHYAHYENEDRIIPLIYLNKLSAYYNVSIDYILGLTNTTCSNQEEIDLVQVGIRLKTFRKEQKLTQTVLAQKINIATSLISDYEKGKLLISTHALYEICKKYKISADYLLGKTDSPKYLE